VLKGIPDCFKYVRWRAKALRRILLLSAIPDFDQVGAAVRRVGGLKGVRCGPKHAKSSAAALTCLRQDAAIGTAFHQLITRDVRSTENIRSSGLEMLKGTKLGGAPSLFRFCRLLWRCGVIPNRPLYGSSLWILM
jgi:hypothetical protein